MTRFACARLAVLALALLIPRSASAQTSDRDRVRRAVLDYVEGFYEGDTVKLVRGIRPDFHKFGFSRDRQTGAYARSPMSFQEAMAYANRIRTRGTPPPPTAPKEIQIFEVLDQTASAKLTAWWGVDYLLLARYGDAWQITHVLWQSPPPRAAQ